MPREGGAIRDKRRAEGRDNQEPPAGLGGIETDLNGLGTERVVFLYAECDVSQGFQQAEFQLDKGFVGRLCRRSEQRELLGLLLRMHAEAGR